MDAEASSPHQGVAAPTQPPPYGRRGSRRAAVREARRRRELGLRKRAAPVAHVARGDRQPRRTGRDALTAAAVGARREAAHRGPQDRRDRATHRHRVDVGHPRVLDHRRARGSDTARVAAQLAPSRDEPRHPRGRRHRDAVRGRRRDGGLRRARVLRRSRRSCCEQRSPCRATPGRGATRAGGTPTGCRRSGSASGCRPAKSLPPRCSAPRNASSTPSSATRSTSPSGCNSSVSRDRPCSPNPRGRPSPVDRSKFEQLDPEMVKGRDTPVVAYRITGTGE